MNLGNGFEMQWDDKPTMKKVTQAKARGEKKAAKRIYRAAKGSTDFKDDSGKLRRSIKMYKSKYKLGGYVVFASAPHSHLVEFGHAQVKDGTSDSKRKAKQWTNTGLGVTIGTVAPKPFMRNAVKSRQAAGFNDMKREIEKVIK